jgi:hypothetical protein
MNAFISWSGDRSKAVALALRDWLPQVINALKVWVSSVDIEKGTRWGPEIAKRLTDSKVGIICLTPENLKSPWILFEAGALSAKLDRSLVCPYLFDLGPADVNGPLVQFQASKAEKEDTERLLVTLNRALGTTSLPDRQLATAFGVWWPKLDEQLRTIGSYRDHIHKPLRTDRELIEEILLGVRRLNHSIRTQVIETDISKDRYDRLNTDAQRRGITVEDALSDLVEDVLHRPDLRTLLDSRLKRKSKPKPKQRQAR